MRSEASSARENSLEKVEQLSRHAYFRFPIAWPLARCSSKSFDAAQPPGTRKLTGLVRAAFSTQGQWLASYSALTTNDRGFDATEFGI